MSHRLLSALLITALVSLVAVQPALAATKADRQEVKRAKLAAKVRSSLTRLGTGPDARVEVRLRNATKVKGYVSSLSDTAFVVTDASGGATEVPYGDVTKVKGQNLATGWKIAIGAGVLFAVIYILVWTGAIGDAER